jgi:hypothetical protein
MIVSIKRKLKNVKPSGYRESTDQFLMYNKSSPCETIPLTQAGESGVLCSFLLLLRAATAPLTNQGNH